MSNLSQWHGASDNHWSPVGATTAILPPGFYEFCSTMLGSYLKQEDPKTDNAIVVADSVSHRIIEQIKIFQSKRADYRRFGLLHKRAIMLEGPAGSGKSMSAKIAGDHIIACGGVVISPGSPNYFPNLPSFLKDLRAIHLEMPVMCILEDIDHEAYNEEYIERHLSLLDGKDQIGNCFYVATTNHIDKIDPRLTNRPKRYDEVIHVGPPSEAARRNYLGQIIPKDQPARGEAIDALTKMGDGFMFSHLNELMVTYLVLDHPLDEAVKRLRAMNSPKNDNDIMGGKASGDMIQLQIPASSFRRR